MAVIIGSARIDERGQAVNGQAGDQTGREVATENYYAHPLGWYAYRAKDPNVANALATAMAQACTNSHIGYDQNQRLGVIKQLQKYHTLGRIAENTECDCSSLVRACCIQAGFDPGNFTTYNEGKALEATGMFEPRITVTNSTRLETGMILVTRKKGHTVIVTKGEARESAKPATNNKGGLNKTPQWVGVVNVSLLNVRTWYGVNPETKRYYPLITKWPGGQLGYGNQVDVCDTVKAKDGSPWYYIRIAGKIYGFVDARYIDKA